MPHTFYRVFRHGIENLSEMKLILLEAAMIDPAYQIEGVHTTTDTLERLKQLYPSGISWHGGSYLLERFGYVDVNGKSYIRHQPLLEWTFELVRLNQFPDAPSRFTSFYGCESLSDAHQFRKEYFNGEGVIYRVSCEQYLRADMSLLLLGKGMPSNLLLAERYWRGEASATPFWEILMQGPVAILEQVG